MLRNVTQHNASWHVTNVTVHEYSYITRFMIVLTANMKRQGLLYVDITCTARNF
jgi:hypothetical protein